MRLTFELNTIIVQKTNCHKLINLANKKFQFFFSGAIWSFIISRSLVRFLRSLFLEEHAHFSFYRCFFHFLWLVSATLIAWVAICVYYHGLYKNLPFIRSTVYEVSSDYKILLKNWVKIDDLIVCWTIRIVQKY